MPKVRNQGLRGKWTEEALQNAVRAIQEGMAINRASKTFLIPRRTLRDYIKKGRARKCLMGRKPILSSEQEEELCARIIRLAEIGYPLTARVLRRCVFTFCKTNNIQNKFNVERELAGRFWLKHFFERHPNNRIRKAQNMNPARAQKLNKFIVTDHFNKLRNILTSLDIIDKPHLIYNMDEKGCRIGLHHQQGVLAKKGAKRVHLVAKEHSENVTIVSCGNAMGSAIPPLILFKGKRMRPEWTDNLPAGSKILMTAKASMTIEAFKEWLHHFAQYKVAGPCLLIFDGAKCHLDHSIATVADELGITLYCLPSNTTHELQPMDKAVFRSFEYYWDDELLKFWARNRDRTLTRQRFGCILSAVWDKCMTPSNIKSGFAACGIYPFDPDKIPDEAFAPSTVTYNPLEPSNQIEDTPEEGPQIGNTERVNRSMEIQRRREVTPQPGSSKTPKSVASSCRKKPAENKDSSESSDGDVEMSDNSTNSDEENDVPEREENTSFTKMLITPDMSRKTTTVRRNPALNSRAQVVTKSLFKTKDLTGNTSSPSISNLKKSSRLTLSKSVLKENGDKQNRKNSTKKMDSWYCKACKEDRIADMHLCFICKCYLHDECVGLTKEDKEECYICPYCS